MAISDIPILSMLRTRLNWNQARQNVLAENVANADTPGFRARDLAPLKFDDATLAAPMANAGVPLELTSTNHIAGLALSASSFKSQQSGRYEVRPTGNAVSVEDQMMKVAETQLDYQAATALYTRSLNLLKTALGKK